MTATTPTLRQRLLLRLLLGGALPSSWAKRVQQAIAADSVWSRAYSDARRAERAGARAFSAGQIDLGEALVLDAVALAEHEHAPHPSWWQQLAPMAAACALVGVFAVVDTSDKGASDKGASDKGADFVARGSSGPVRVGVRLRCLDAARGRVIDEAEAGPATSDALQCPRGGLVSFGLTNLEADDVYVYAVGVAADGALRFFSPFDEPSSSLKVEAGVVDRVLDVAADTAAFPAGDVTVFTLFSARPLRGADVARTLRDVQQRTGRVQALDRLPLDALTARIDLRP